MDDLAPRLQRSLGDAYTIERELGGGGMARVFVARDRALDRQVVVKALDLQSSAAASGERFRREVRVIATLQHPHIVPVLTAGGDDSLLWYVMPFVAGESLRARLVRDGALTVADTLRIIRGMLDALGFAHERGIVHRDVKPENILLEGKHAVVADFGVAKALADAGVTSGLTTAGMALGTPAYMAPEQAMADPTTNHRADLYAAGAVIYEMLVGAPPYSGNAQAVVAAHLTAPVPRVTDRRGDVPPMLASLIERLLAKNPAERPQSAHEAVAVLDDVTTPGSMRVAASAPAPTTTAPPGAPKVITPRQTRVMMGAIVVALVAAAAMVGTWWARRAGAAPVAKGADVIAVMPLGTTGDSALARLGRDLVVTLSANIDGVGDLRAVDAMSVIARARESLPLDEARALGRELRAGSVLHGSLVREGPLVRATMVLAPVDGGDPIARVSATAPADSVRALTDLLTKDVLERVWRRGRAPSPVLSEVTTTSNEALRAFLAGERYFEQFLTDSAIAEYTRATQADSMFAQAYQRLSEVRARAVYPSDPAVRERLAALIDRLPPRDQALLRLNRATGLTPRQRIDSGLALAAKYPDHPTAQYEAADRIIHGGPMVGVPIERALPLLDRLDILAPNHSDNAVHRVMVTDVLGDTAGLAGAVKRLATSASGPIGDAGRAWDAALTEQAQHGTGVTAEMIAEQYRRWARIVRSSPILGWIPAMRGTGVAPPAVLDSGLAITITDGTFRGIEPVSVVARGGLAITRGEFARGVALLGTIETSRAPVPIRTAAARSAVLASWLGGMSPASADSVLARTRANVTDATGFSAAELEWLDGVIGIVSGDSARVTRASAAIPDTTVYGRRMRASLRGLWRERTANAVDSLIALEDSAMTGGGMLHSALFLHRLAIGRALTRAGDPARAEYYLQWPDARIVDSRGATVSYAFGPYNSYQRGLAFEAAGDRARAILHLSRFVDVVDRPPPAIKAQVDDARARLAKLTGDARR